MDYHMVDLKRGKVMDLAYGFIFGLYDKVCKALYRYPSSWSLHKYTFVTHHRYFTGRRFNPEISKIISKIITFKSEFDKMDLEINQMECFDGVKYSLAVIICAFFQNSYVYCRYQPL